MRGWQKEVRLEGKSWWNNSPKWLTLSSSTQRWSLSIIFDELIIWWIDHLIYSIFLYSKVILINYHCHLWSSWTRGRLCDWFSWRILLLSSQSQTCSDSELAGQKVQKKLDVKCYLIIILLTFVMKPIETERQQASKFISLRAKTKLALLRWICHLFNSVTDWISSINHSSFLSKVSVIT